MPKITSSRTVTEIVKDLVLFNPKTAKVNDRLAHDCYMIFVGHVKGDRELKKWTEMINAKEASCEDGIETAESIFIMECEEVECILEHIELFHHSDELINARNEHFVYEDHFNPTLCGIVEENFSYEKLKKLCRRYETKPNVNVDKVMAKHEARVAQSSVHFRKLGLSEVESQALALAISFYTGTESETVSRGASLVARRANGVVVEPKVAEELNEAALILYYLVKALSYLPYYWGYVTRACNLNDQELAMYTPGNLITWIQFSSSKKGKKVAEGFDFSNRNTVFKIYSLTGRPIKDFSNFPNEDEVLFLPHSTFLVFKHVVAYHGTQHTIYMRQVEPGLSTWAVLWVDDEIFNENWENKKHMEYASAKALNMNVHFIPKSTTELALSFLRSPFGQRLKNKEIFRIVTDMNRKNEDSVHDAGVRFIKEARKLGFRNKCMVFTSDKQRAEETIKSELKARDPVDVIVTTKVSDLRNFVNFDRQATDMPPSSAANSAKYCEMPNFTQHGDCSGSYQSHGATASTLPKSSVNNNSLMRMHNPENTNIEIIMRNCTGRQLTNSRNNCVLITTGSFNPVHCSHFRNLLRVKEYLENEHQPPLNVLAGYISPTHDDYVRPKLGDLDWIPAIDRCELCEQALEYHEGPEIKSWITISRGESGWSGGFVDFGPVAERFCDFLNKTLVQEKHLLKYPVHTIYVCGLDHFNKCRSVEKMTTQENMDCAVVYRPGYDEQQIYTSMKSSGVFYIPLLQERNKLRDISSTEIRTYFRNPTSSKSGIEQFIYPCVRRYMTKKHKK